LINFKDFLRKNQDFISKVKYKIFKIIDNPSFAKEDFEYLRYSNSGKFMNNINDHFANQSEVNFNKVCSNNSLNNQNLESFNNYFNSQEISATAETDNCSFKDRIINFHTSIEFHLSKYAKINEKLTEKINYVNSSGLMKNNSLSYTFVMFKNPIDWILLVENKLYNEKNPLFFSFRWLSCNSIPIYNFYKDLMKRSKLKDIFLIKIPCDDIIYSNFRRQCIWNFSNVNKAHVLDEVLMNSLLSNFLRVEFDNNYVYYSEEFNMLIKISQKVVYNLIKLFFNFRDVFTYSMRF
jgi:hypothetical protein